MTDVRIIKRYANRKLYDTQHSRYVTLDQISEMIRNGDDVKIIDNKSKEDLTSVTLAQIIFEQEKKQRSFLPLQAMRNIIQNGGESFAQFVTEAQRRVTQILPLRKEDEEEGVEGAGMPGIAPAPGAAAAADATSDETGDGKRPRPGILEFREWLQQSQRTIEEWQKRVDDRIRNVAGGISPFAGLHKELQMLASRIGELEVKLGDAAERERAAAEAQRASDGSDDRETGATTQHGEHSGNGAVSGEHSAASTEHQDAAASSTAPAVSPSGTNGHGESGATGSGDVDPSPGTEAN